MSDSENQETQATSSVDRTLHMEITYISQDTLNSLPSYIGLILVRLKKDDQLFFEGDYQKKKKKAWLNFLLSMFGFNYLYMREFFLFIVFILFGWCTLGVWWLYNIVTSMRTVDLHNEKLTIKIFQEIKLFNDIRENNKSNF